MLLRSLKLKDFRQFKGEQCVTFSTDPVRNVTVIMGENGSGKTTLAQAFTWCLYGDTDFDDKVMLCKATAQAMLPNTEETVRVELALMHNGIDYLCLRTCGACGDDTSYCHSDTRSCIYCKAEEDGSQDRGV